MEQITESVANGLGGTITWLAETGALFAVFLVIWLGFGAALVWRQGTLDRAWARVQSLPIVARGLLWLLFLPVMVGLWVWERVAWPRSVRLAVVLSLAAWNLLVFLPGAVPS